MPGSVADRQYGWTLRVAQALAAIFCCELAGRRRAADRLVGPLAGAQQSHAFLPFRPVDILIPPRPGHRSRQIFVRGVPICPAAPVLASALAVTLATLTAGTSMRELAELNFYLSGPATRRAAACDHEEALSKIPRASIRRKANTGIRSQIVAFEKLRETASGRGRHTIPRPSAAASSKFWTAASMRSITPSPRTPA